MNVIQIIGGVLLIISCLVIILIVLAQNSKDPGMTSAITGSANDSFYGKNGGKTRDAKLSKFTRFAAIVFISVTLIVNILAVYTSK